MNIDNVGQLYILVWDIPNAANTYSQQKTQPPKIISAVNLCRAFVLYQGTLLLT